LLQLVLADIRRGIAAGLQGLVNGSRRGAFFERRIDPLSLAVLREVDANQLVALRLPDDGIVLHNQRLQGADQRLLAVAEEAILRRHALFILRIIDRWQLPIEVQKWQPAA